jgi:dTDP-glucose 4,6-dehydratase
MQTLLVTGGAGFIGSNLVRSLLADTQHHIVVLDALTYAGNLESIEDCLKDDRVVFHKGSITDRDVVRSILKEHAIEGIIHLAAESHVDRSIRSAEPFIHTNVHGTMVLLEEARNAEVKRFLHVSTDEVYGSLRSHDMPFTEASAIRPSSPYAASKAGSDHLALSFHVTYGLDVVVTRCSNNYGPYQFPEKLIPLFTLNALEDRPLPIYGDGRQIRDWIHVEDHCRGLLLAYDMGRSGEVYNFGGRNEEENLAVARSIVNMVGASDELITFVEDRLGHDRRYAISSAKAELELGWKAEKTFPEGLRETVEWYRMNSTWCNHVRTGEYRSFYHTHYGSPL